MTFIQPNQKNLINTIIAILIIAVAFVALSLIFIYNRSVNLEHSVSGAENELRQLETSRAEIQDKIFAILSDDNLQKVSASKGFIKDKNPIYFKISQVPAAEAVIANR